MVEAATEGCDEAKFRVGIVLLCTVFDAVALSLGDVDGVPHVEYLNCRAT